MVYEEEGLPFTQDLSLENSADSNLFFWLPLLHSVSYFFFLYQSPSLSLWTIFYSISSNIDEVLSINPSANTFIFGYFKIHHKDWLSYSGGTNRLVNCYLRPTFSDSEFSYSDPKLSLSQYCSFGFITILLTIVFVSQWLSLHWEIMMFLSQFPLTCQTHNNCMHCFIPYLMINLVLIGAVFVIIWEM